MDGDAKPMAVVKRTTLLKMRMRKVRSIESQ
jgi:hypothetical protein